MARTYAVFSAIGADRVGIVDDLSGIIAEDGCNIEESRMAVLGGEFAVIMLLSAEAGGQERLAARLGGLESGLGLRLSLKGTREPSQAAGGRPYLLESVSLDGSGIVHAVSSVLRRHGINIEDLETDTASAPLTGAPLFRMRAGIVIGPGTHVAVLRKELEELQATQDLDIQLRPLVPSRSE